MDTLFIESIYLIAAAGKLFHGLQEVRKAWMFSFLLQFKVCSGEGWCTSLGILTSGGQLSIAHLAAEDFFLGSEYLCPVCHQSSLVKAGLLLPHRSLCDRRWSSLGGWQLCCR